MHNDHSDNQFSADLMEYERRRALAVIAGTSATLLLSACGPGGPGGPPPMSDPESNQIGKGADGGICVKDPQETNGPYPADGTNSKNGQTVNVLTESGVVRSDIRASFGTMQGTADGALLKITAKLVDVGNACAPLANHIVYIWHCDAEGQYSLYDIADQNYLRGVAVTDVNGAVSFTTIVPGTYMGRYPHIHFEVFENAAAAINGRQSLLISQFAVPADILKPLYDADTRYKNSIKPLVNSADISTDNVFGNNTPEQIKTQTLIMSGDAATGYNASATIGIAKKA